MIKIRFVNKYISVLGLLVLLSACVKNSDRDEIVSRNKELLVHLKNSKGVLIDENNMEVSGQFEGDSMLVEYYSVSPGEFYKAAEESEEYIKSFSHEDRFNEVFGDDVYRIEDSLLIVSADGKRTLFEDDARERSWFFYENKLGNLHVIKSIQFEDAETLFLSSQTGEIEFNLMGIRVATNSKERLVFYADVMNVDLKDSTEVSFFRVNSSDSLDTLVTVYTEWFPRFAFFKNPHQLYYVHSVFDGNRILQSSYAKMEIQRK